MGQMPSDKLLRPNIPGDPHFRKVAHKLEFTQPNALGKPKKTSKVAEVTAHPLPAVVITRSLVLTAPQIPFGTQRNPLTGLLCYLKVCGDALTTAQTALCGL